MGKTLNYLFKSAKNHQKSYWPKMFAHRNKSQKLETSIKFCIFYTHIAFLKKMAEKIGKLLFKNVP
jgi:hypothetical protein